MGVKERRTKILLAFMLLSDPEFKDIVIDGKFQKIFDLAFNQKTKNTLGKLLKEELITKITSELTQDEDTYRLTEKGFEELCMSFPYFRYLRTRWDGKWRILSYEIPEKKREIRDRLRREVAGWGLGPWHRSFWLTPHPIISNLKSLLSDTEEQKYAQAFESDHVFGDREILIEKVWGKASLDKKYRELFKTWHLILSKDEDKLDKFSKIVNSFINVLRDDSGLPAELVGDNWIGFEAFNIFKEIRTILLS